MAYREDRDLAFLGEMDSKSLNDLVSLLIKDKDGEIRLTEELTRSENYKKYSPDHQKYWREIAAEIQCFGANTIVTMFRGGKGVLYREVLEDAAGRFKAEYPKGSDVRNIEQSLLAHIWDQSWGKMDKVNRDKLMKELKIRPDYFAGTGGASLAAFQTLFTAGGFMSYQLTRVIANTVMRSLFGSGLSFAANATLARTAAILMGPVGWTFSGLWTLGDIAGPAYRVTMPAVLQIALLRQQHELELGKLWDSVEKELGIKN